MMPFNNDITKGNTCERNNTVDIIRGIAMLLVVLGHTMLSSVESATNSGMYQIIWSLQMPLFMIISGYVTKYSKPFETWKELISQMKKRTLSYLLPWAVWTFVVRGIAFGQTDFLNLKWLIYHMDGGYWFLFSIWTITMIYTVCSFVANKVKNGLLIKTITYVTGMMFLAGIGYALDFSFLCVKLTLYYMPFYFAGCVYTEIERVFHNKKWFERVKQITIAGCFALWILTISRVNIYNLDETIAGIMLRVFSSVTGCIAVIGLISSLPIKRLRIIEYVGKHTLEVYTIHYLLLNLIKISPTPNFESPQGLILIIVNFVLTLTLSVTMIMIISGNSILKKVLFYKK